MSIGPLAIQAQEHRSGPAPRRGGLIYPARCVVCKDRWPCEPAYEQLQAKLDIATGKLEKIAMVMAGRGGDVLP